MQCYEVFERVRKGIGIAADPVPHVPVCKEAFDLEMPLDEDLGAFLKTLPPTLPAQDLVLARADVIVSQRRVVFTRPRDRLDRKALVRVQAWSGVNGAVELTSTDRREGKFEAFPPRGVQALVNKRGGVRNDLGESEHLDLAEVLVVMEPKTRLRIARTGKFMGKAWRAMIVAWDGQRLTAREAA